MNENIDVLDLSSEAVINKTKENKDVSGVVSGPVNKEFLPLGSVVLLKEATKKIMIVGFLTSRADDDKVYDYSGCLFPEGVLSSDEFLLFDEDDIGEVIAKGFENEETAEFKKQLVEIINKS